MDSLSETVWDVVIRGTGLQESLLALSLSRSDKKVLHIDANGYYGGPDASLSLPEADQWAGTHASSRGTPSSPFRSASATRSPGLSSPRAYSLALSPQIIHSRSALLSQLVSSRAYRQVEFLAVGSFFVCRPEPSEPGRPPSLARIPSTREDVFSTTVISARAKRSLMKFLKFVLDYESAEQTATWEPFADRPLSDFLQARFGLDAELQDYVHTLTLSLRETITTRDGLRAIHRHLTSMGVFGPGFAAVYPKWGGISEIAQVACRAGAVGGAVYMLGTEMAPVSEQDGDTLKLSLSNELGDGGVQVEARLLVEGSQYREAGGESGSWTGRLVAVVDSPLSPLFEVVAEGAPAPAVAVVVFPSGPQSPIYVFAHSSETGECPVGQSMLYFTTRTNDEGGSGHTRSRLESALSSLLAAAAGSADTPTCLYQLYYERRCEPATAGPSAYDGDAKVLALPGSSAGLAFDDADLEPVRRVWERILGPETEEAAEGAIPAEYMTFSDHRGAEESDDDL